MESQKIQNRIPIVGCRIEFLNCRITPKMCLNADLNPNRDWDLPITGIIALEDCFFLIFGNDYLVNT